MLPVDAPFQVGDLILTIPDCGPHSLGIDYRNRLVLLTKVSYVGGVLYSLEGLWGRKDECVQKFTITLPRLFPAEITLLAR